MAEMHAPLDSIPVVGADDGMRDASLSALTTRWLKEDSRRHRLLLAAPRAARRPLPVPALAYWLKGEFTVRYADGHDETIRAGEAYYMPPGHAPRF